MRKHACALALASLVLVAGTGLGAVVPGRGVVAAGEMPSAAGARARGDPGAPGSASNPIPVSPTETRAIRGGVPGGGGQIVVRVGALRARLHGTPTGVVAGGGILDDRVDFAWPSASNRYAGGGAEVAIGRFSGLSFEGGRVTLRDPIDVLAWGGARSEYWTGSAGLSIRF